MSGRLDELWREAVELQEHGRMREGYERLRELLRLRMAERPEPPPARRRVEVPRTTLCCVDCSYLDLAAYALKACLQRCSFARALLLTDAEFKIPGVETVRIDRLESYDAYSHFMLKELDRYIDTDFALVVQYDGYVLNGEHWTADFQRYDYIGAPWPTGDWMSVGNGGFSLRSKKLLRALRDPEIVPQGQEDLSIGRVYRALLEERYGIEFAPEEIAAAFSFETVPPSAPTFGFHGIGHAVNLFGCTPAEAAAYRPPPVEIVVGGR